MATISGALSYADELIGDKPFTFGAGTINQAGTTNDQARTAEVHPLFREPFLLPTPPIGNIFISRDPIQGSICHAPQPSSLFLPATPILALDVKAH